MGDALLGVEVVGEVLAVAVADLPAGGEAGVGGLAWLLELLGERWRQRRPVWALGGERHSRRT